MGRLFECELNGQFYSCRACSTHLASLEDLMSKNACGGCLHETPNFQSRNGKAYLFNSVVNVSVGVLEDKIMLTGLHTVADIYCNKCNRLLGWKYEKAFQKTQKYKEGRFILERCKLKQGDGSVFFDQPEMFQNEPNSVYNSDDVDG